MKKNFFNIRFAAIILIAAGYGWADGHYIPANSSILTDLLQFILIAATLIMGITYLSIPEKEMYKSNWSITGLSIFLIISSLINIYNIIHGAHHSGATSFGSPNNFGGLMPVALLITGNGLWVVTMVQRIRHRTKVRHLFKSEYNIL
jgi:hypothetical protein